MSVQVIPVTADPQATEMQITLDGLPFQLKTYYNRRRGTWHMCLRTQDGTDIVNGVPIFVGWPPLARFKDTRLPPGTFLPVDTSSAGADPLQNDFGTRVVLLYIEAGTFA